MTAKRYIYLALLIVFCIHNAAAQGPGHVNLTSGAWCKLSGGVFMNVKGNLMNRGTFASSGFSTIKFTGTQLETIGGTGSTQFENAEMNNNNNFRLTGHVNVDALMSMLAGTLDVDNYNLIFGSVADVQGAFGTSRMIIADATNGNTGQIMKVYPSGASSFFFPIGDFSATTDYSPVALNFTANSAIRTIGLKVTDLKHPNDFSPNNYITRYWSFSDNLCNGSYTYNATFTFSQNAPTDLAGNYNSAGVSWWSDITSIWTGISTEYPGAPDYVVRNVNQTAGSLCGNDYTARESCIPAKIVFITPDKYKCTRDSVLFKVITVGTPPFSFQWSKAGTDIPNATRSTYIISVLLQPDAGKFTCRVINPCGSESADVNLTVNTAPFIKDTIKNTYVCEGSNISFNVNATGDDLHYQWTKGGVSIPGATNSTIAFSNVKKSDENTYSCVVSNNCDTKYLEPFILFINQKPVINTIPITQTKNPGESISYYLNPLGLPPFTFQWKKNNVNIPGATKNFYEVQNLTCDDAGNYTCEISNSCGKITTPIGTLIVNGCGIFTVSGIVTYDNKNLTPMTYTIVYLETPEGDKIDSTKTDNAGIYTFFSVPNGSYKLKCKTDKAWGGADPLDALIVNRYFIGIYTFTDMLKKQVADVNLDTKINPTDALFINRRFIGLITKFTLSDWVFTVPSITVSGGNVTQDIMAICAGDVNGSYIPKAKKYLKHNMGIMNDKQVFADLNRDFLIPVYLNDFAEIGALGLKLKVQDSKFRVIDVSSGMDGLLYNITEDGVNIAWSALDKGFTAEPGIPLFTLKMRKAETGAGTSELLIQVSSESVLSDIDIIEMSTELLQMPKLMLRLQASGFNLQSYPNPFSANATFVYNLPEVCLVSLKVYNAIGNLVTELVRTIEKTGNHSALFDGTNLSPGIYMYKFNAIGTSDSFNKSGIMIMSK